MGLSYSVLFRAILLSLALVLALLACWDATHPAPPPRDPSPARLETSNLS